MAAAATRNATVAKAPAPGLPGSYDTAPRSNARTASAPRVARTAPARGSAQPASHAAAAAAIVQPASSERKPSPRNESRAPPSESSSHPHARPWLASATSALREASSAATAIATAQASKAARIDRRSSRKPMPTPIRPTWTSLTADCTNASVPAGARASRSAWPSVAPVARTTDPTPMRRVPGSSPRPPGSRVRRTSCHTKPTKGGATMSHSVRERAVIDASSGYQDISRGDVPLAHRRRAARSTPRFARARVLLGPGVQRNGLRWPSPPEESRPCRSR